MIKTFTRWDLDSLSWDMLYDEAYYFLLVILQKEHAEVSVNVCVQSFNIGIAWVNVCMSITSNGFFPQCLPRAERLFIPRKDLPFFLSVVHWEHCSLCSLFGMLKSPDIFVLHLKRELRWAIEGLCPGHFNFFLFFHDSWKSSRQSEKMGRLENGWRGYWQRWGYYFEGQAETMCWLLAKDWLWCIAWGHKCPEWAFFPQMFLPFSLERHYNETTSKAAICKSRAWRNG